MAIAVGVLVVGTAGWASYRYVFQAPIRHAHAAFDEWFGDSYCKGAPFPCKLEDCHSVVLDGPRYKPEHQAVWRCDIRANGQLLGIVAAVYDTVNNRVDRLSHTFETRFVVANGKEDRAADEAIEWFWSRVFDDLPDMKEADMKSCGGGRWVHSLALAGCATGKLHPSGNTWGFNLDCGDAKAQATCTDDWSMVLTEFVLKAGHEHPPAHSGARGASTPSTTQEPSQGRCAPGQEVRRATLSGEAPEGRGCVEKGTDRKQGRWVFYYASGQEHSELTFKDGTPYGPSIDWYLSGKKKVETNFVAGKQNGRFVSWQEDGARIEATMKDDKLDGIATAFDASGNKKSQVTFKEGEQVGPEMFFDANGQVIEQPRAGATLNLPVGRFAATTPQWKAARDAVLAWCGANPGKCAEVSVQHLLKPLDGELFVPAERKPDDNTLFVPGETEPWLTTCSPAKCGTYSEVSFVRAGGAWTIAKVEELKELAE